jgi:hypothetical protein
MSQENELVRRVYERWARRDFSEIEAFHREIDFEMVEWPHQTRVRGVDAMRDTWRATLSARGNPRDHAALHGSLPASPAFSRSC